MYVCVCNAVTEREVVAAVRSGASSLEDVAFELGVSTCCGRCADCAVQLIERTRGPLTPASIEGDPAREGAALLP